MTENAIKVYTAFVLGISSTLGVLEIVRILPFEEYFKTILRVIMPIPPILIALVMVNYGPDSYRESAVAQCSPAEMFRVFLGGAFSGLLFLGVINVFRMLRDDE